MVRITLKKKNAFLRTWICTRLFLMLCILFSTISVFFLLSQQHEFANANKATTSSTLATTAATTKTSITTTTTKIKNITEQEQREEAITKTKERYSLSKNLNRRSADDIWKALIQKGHELNSQTDQSSSSSSSSPMVSMEVGMHKLHQCLFAARNNFTTHCIEPSPKSYKFILSQYQTSKKREPDAAKRINLYNVAAGNTTGTTLPFTSQGSTGDHIGDFSMWYMKVTPHNATTGSTESSVDVPIVKLDDIIDNKIIPTDSYYNNKDDDTKERTNEDKIGAIFSLKVDTQGFEPSVFSGLKSSIEQHKIQYILFEYWPKGMDLLSHSNLETKCETSTAILLQLAKAGYKLYPLNVVTHPKRPVEARKYLIAQEGRPYDDFKMFCMWYYNIEELFPSEEYHMGYWTDILAISPEVKELDKKVDLLLH